VTILDTLAFALGALRGFHTRSLLMMLAMAIGVASVIMLTALGEGARNYVTGQFASLGTNLVIVLPGRTETTGAGAFLLTGTTPRDLTLDDAKALVRGTEVRRIAPMMVGSVMISAGGLEKEAPVIGSTPELLSIRHWQLAQGRFLPPGDMERAAPVCVMGAKIRRELFGARPVLGEWVRMGEWRCRVIGVLGSTGRSIGVDVQDLVIIPVASAQALFNSQSLFRLLVEARSRGAIERVKGQIRSIIRERHQGEEDITVITQDAVLGTFDKIFQALTLTVAGIAAISLAVAGILVMNVMLVAVSQRTPEIGLLKALGASARRIMMMFLVEAAILSLLGAAAGVGVGLASTRLLVTVYPDLPAQAPAWSIASAMGVALVTGILFGILPARRGARLDPVQALSRR
jgi:putative ABC transport system permease protein